MAYMSQENKKEKQEALKKVIPKSWKWSLGVHHHSTLVLNIYSAPVDLVGEWHQKRLENRRGLPPEFEQDKCPSHVQVNEYHLEAQFDKSLAIMTRIKDAMMTGNHNNSDSMTDYFDVGWYIHINLGKWNKPFILTGKTEETTDQAIARLEKENQTLKAMHPQFGLNSDKPKLTLIKPALQEKPVEKPCTCIECK